MDRPNKQKSPSRPSAGFGGPVVQVTFHDMLPDETAVRHAFTSQMKLRQKAAWRRCSAVLALSPVMAGQHCGAELRLKHGGAVQTVRVQGPSPAEAVARAYELLEADSEGRPVDGSVLAGSGLLHGAKSSFGSNFSLMSHASTQAQAGPPPSS